MLLRGPGLTRDRAPSRQGPLSELLSAVSGPQTCPACFARHSDAKRRRQLLAHDACLTATPRPQHGLPGGLKRVQDAPLTWEGVARASSPLLCGASRARSVPLRSAAQAPRGVATSSSCAATSCAASERRSWQEPAIAAPWQRVPLVLQVQIFLRPAAPGFSKVRRTARRRRKKRPPLSRASADVFPSFLNLRPGSLCTWLDPLVAAACNSRPIHGKLPIFASQGPACFGLLPSSDS